MRQLAIALLVGCTYVPKAHAPYSGENYAPVDAATLTKLENGFARLSQGLADNEDVVLLRSHVGKHLKIEGTIMHAVLGDPNSYGVTILISPADAPDQKVVLHQRTFSLRKQQQEMMQHLSNTPDAGVAYVRVHDYVGEPDAFELHAIGLAGDTYLAY